MRKNIFLLVGVVLTLSGCATLGTTSGELIQVVSNPSGARIEVDNNYVCDTPCTVNFVKPRDILGSYEVRLAVIKAYPTMAGQCVQTKLLPSYEATPERIYFDMYLCGAPAEININVNR